MQAPYSIVGRALADHNVLFTTDGAERHKPTDIIIFSQAVAIEPYTAFLAGNHLCSMGSFSYSWSALPADSIVGRYCSIARGVGVMGVRHPYERVSSSSFTYDGHLEIFKRAALDFKSQFRIERRIDKNETLQIGHDAWIGANSILKRGVKIGTGSVIAGNSVVTKDVPPYTIVGGNPARVIKSRFPDELIADLLASEWWQYKFTDFEGLKIKDPSAFVSELKRRVHDGLISPYCPQALTLETMSPRPLV